jgi:hypothetical protein
MVGIKLINAKSPKENTKKHCNAFLAIALVCQRLLVKTAPAATDESCSFFLCDLLVQER